MSATVVTLYISIKAIHAILLLEFIKISRQNLSLSDNDDFGINGFSDCAFDSVATLVHITH